MIEKVKISQKEFDELYEIDKPVEEDKDKDKETVLNNEEQAFDDKIEDMEEWG